MPRIPFLPRPEGDVVGYVRERGLGQRGNPFLGYQQGLDTVEWCYESRSYRALTLDFRVQTTDRELGAYLDEIFSELATHGQSARSVRKTNWYSVLTPTSGLLDGYAVSYNGQRLVTTDHPAHALRTMLAHLNAVAVEHGDGMLLLHAAAVTLGRRAVVLSAPSGSGKSTLAAGLVRSGAGYLSDEIAAIDEGLVVHAFPKSLSVDPGAWAVLPELEPAVPAGIVPYLTEQWQVVPESIRPGAAVKRGCVAAVVIPSYSDGAELSLQRLAPIDTLMLLVDQTLGFKRAPQHHLDLLAVLVTNTPCYRLVHGNLGEAVAAVADLLGQD